MMKILYILAAITLAVLADDSPALTELKRGNFEFTAKTYKALAKDNTDNFLVCPLSIEIVFALVETGADGDTAKQLIAGLNLPSTEKNILEAFKAISPSFYHNKGYTLIGANKIYVKEGFNIKPEFKSVATEVFEAQTQEIDFTNADAATTINNWISEKTRKKINNIISRDDLDPDTRAVLINSLYFHGLWSSPFEIADTKEKIFHVNSKTDVKVKIMEQTEKFNYYRDESLKAKFLEMEYYDCPITMTVILPDDIDGLSDLEKNIEKVLNAPKYSKTKVHVQIPKINIEHSIDFKPILQQFGVKDVFEKKSDLSRLAIHSEDLRISKVVQKTHISIEEKGTIAEAVTIAIAVADLIDINPPPVQEFEANHPFIFVVKSPEGILFVGRYVKPN